jgi:hypothetical protein
MLSGIHNLFLDKFLTQSIDLNAPQEQYQNRFDNKFLMYKKTLSDFILELDNSWRLLQVDDRTSQTYINWHFDTKNLDFYRDHIKLKRKRVKIRIRKYPNQICMLDLKLKGKRGETVKHRWPYQWDGETTPIISNKYLSVISEAIESEYQRKFYDNLLNTSTSKYLRTTLISNSSFERITVDEHFSTLVDTKWKNLLDEIIILEIKSIKIKSKVASKLYNLGSRPRPFSKYLLSVSQSKNLRLRPPWSLLLSEIK